MFISAVFVQNCVYKTGGQDEKTLSAGFEVIGKITKL